MGSRKEELTSDNGLANTAFLLGVGAALTSFALPQFGWAVLGLPLGLTAVLFGITGITKARDKGGRRLAIWGVALGLISPIGGLAFWALLIEVIDVSCC